MRFGFSRCFYDAQATADRFNFCQLSALIWIAYFSAKYWWLQDFEGEFQSNVFLGVSIAQAALLFWYCDFWIYHDKIIVEGVLNSGVLKLSLIVTLIMGLALTLGGIVLIYLGAVGETELDLIGIKIRIKSVGAVSVLSGAVLVGVNVWRTHVAMERLLIHSRKMQEKNRRYNGEVRDS